MTQLPSEMGLHFAPEATTAYPLATELFREFKNQWNNLDPDKALPDEDTRDHYRKVRFTIESAYHTMAEWEHNCTWPTTDQYCRELKRVLVDHVAETLNALNATFPDRYDTD